MRSRTSVRRFAVSAACALALAGCGEPYGAPVRVVVPPGSSFSAAADSLARAGLVWLSRVDQAEGGAVEALRALARQATGREPVSGLRLASDVVEVIYAAYQSAEEGRRITLELN